MQIIKSIDFIEALAPALYEMIIVDKGKKEKVSDIVMALEDSDHGISRALPIK